MYRLLMNILCAALAAGTIASCAARQAAESDSEMAVVNSLAILPAEVRLTPNEPAVDRYQLRQGAEVLDAILADHFGDSEMVTLVTENQKEAMAPGVVKSREELARTIGAQLEADGVLLTVVERYFERVGTEYTIESPASVAFRYQLLQVESGSSICAGEFDETQQPLFENILSFGKARKRGFKWVTAERLTRDGFQAVLQNCPELKELR